MVLQALLISEDDDADAVLSQVLSGFGVALQRSDYPNGVFCLPDQKPDALIVDFDDLQQAISIVQKVGAASLSPVPIIIALLSNKGVVRKIFGAGANFILYKPISEDQAHAALLAAIALIKRERRRRFRVPVQAPVRVQLEDGSQKEGVVLDLSEGGMDLIMPEPIATSSKLRAKFTLPDGCGDMELTGEIAWGNPNGQSGVRFTDLPQSVHSKLVKWVEAHAEDLIPDDPGSLECKLSDLSLGGCYVETESPFPEHSVVGLCVKASKTTLNAEGTVRIMHPGTGMGIELTLPTQAQQNEVQNILNLLTSNPEMLPELQVAPVALSGSSRDQKQTNKNRSTDNSDDSLLQLLHNHESLSQEEFLQELRQQRTCYEAAPA